MTLLATAHAAGGGPEQASHVGRKALDLTVRLSSARSVRYIRNFTRMLRRVIWVRLEQGKAGEVTPVAPVGFVGLLTSRQPNMRHLFIRNSYRAVLVRWRVAFARNLAGLRVAGVTEVVISRSANTRG
jgi:hypothetical protein